MPKLLRITTVPMSLRYLLRGQIKYMSQHGIDVVMASADGKEINDVVDYEKVPHQVIGLTRSITPLKDLAALVKLAVFIRKERFDIIHSHTPKAGLIGMLAGFLGGAKVRLHTIAGVPWMERSGIMRSILKLTDKVAYSFATRVYSNSFNLMDFVLKERIVKGTKLKVLMNGSSNGIDSEFFNSDAVDLSKKQIRQELGISDTAFVFIFIGRIVKDKGIEELVKAFMKINGEPHLILVGPLEQELNPISLDTLGSISGESRIHQLGYLNDVRPALKASDALVFPSYREGFPNVPMQAGAMGLPSIVTDINGCNEIIIDNENGILVRPKDMDSLLDALRRMIDEKDDYIRMKERSRDMIVSRFDQELIWSEIYKEYIELVGTS